MKTILPGIPQYPAQRDWQSAEAAADYRRKRDPKNFHRYHKEEAIVNAWLDDLPRGALVLDVPCGTGRFVNTVTSHGFRYVGADISQAMILEARQQSNSSLVQPFVHADAANLPFDDNQVDCVIIWRLLHHIQDAPVRQAILREAARVTRSKVLISFHHSISFTACVCSFCRNAGLTLTVKSGFMETTRMKARFRGGGKFAAAISSSNSIPILASRCRIAMAFAGVFVLMVGFRFELLAAVPYQQILNLVRGGDMGLTPYATPTEGPGGALFGTTRTGGKFGQGTAFKINKDGTGFQILHQFSGGPNDGAEPYSEFVLGSDGALYRTTLAGGLSDYGTIFKIETDGTQFSVVVHFPSVTDGGLVPRGHLVVGDDGAFYGTATGGGEYGAGVVYKVNQNGTGYRELYAFQGLSSADGAGPLCGLVKGSDGGLYGTAFGGGTTNGIDPYLDATGTIYRLNQDGGGYAVLHTFLGALFGDGQSPHARLLEASDGNLYGITVEGGVTNTPFPFPPGRGYGTVFKLNKNGSDYTVLHRFTNNAGGGEPFAQLIEGDNGALYGAKGSVNSSVSSIFRINKEGSEFVTVRDLGSSITDGTGLSTGLLKGSNGYLYGAAGFGGSYNGGAIFRINEDGADYCNVVEFVRSNAAARLPRSPAISSRNGRIFCVTEGGGAVTNAGTLFGVNRDGGDYFPLHSFGVVTNDGRIPNAMLEASDGLLYGTTQSGGTNNGGVIFRVDRDGTNYVVLRRFTLADGLSPKGGLIEGGDGWLYGAANVGGSTGRGTVFKLDKNGSGFVVLWNFLGGTADGGAPQGELLEGTNGVLYGTTRLFGSASRGTIFCIHPNDSGHDILHHFAGGDDGQNPMAGLLLASDGALYGTTSGGNTNGGTVFALNHDGSGYRVLRTFGTTGAEPRNLRGRLVEGPDGLLYGTTYQGSSNGFGTVFALAKDGTGFRVVWHFGADAIDGRSPVAGLTVGPDGVLYGNTEAGGGQNLGTFFRLDPRDVGLSIAAEGLKARVHWPVTGTADALEESSAWSSGKPTWGAAGAMVSSNAANYEATMPLSGTNRFLRVRREWR